MAEATPAVLYHGTNPIAAVLIHTQNAIRATEPVDDDGLGPVVCTTSSEQVAEMFAIEFLRFNSQYDVGFVFEIDGAAVASDMEAVYHEAGTAGTTPEFEYRVRGSIAPLDRYLLGVRVVGDRGLLEDEDFLERMHRDAPSALGGYEEFRGRLDALVEAADRCSPGAPRP